MNGNSKFGVGGHEDFSLSDRALHVQISTHRSLYLNEKTL